MLHTASALAIFYGVWLLLSGYFTAFLLAVGAGSALSVILLSRRMRIMDREGYPLHLLAGALFSYWPWLIKKIVKSAWDVTALILHPRLPISPTLKRFKPSQITESGLVVHANSITLTPGTISVDVGPGEFLVHALTSEGASALEASEMDRRVTRLEARN